MGYSIVNRNPSIVYIDHKSITKLGANYYSIKRIDIVEKLTKSEIQSEKLKVLVRVKNKKRKPVGKEKITYIGLADINSDTGVIDIKTVSDLNIEGTSVIIESGDILFSKLRPNLNKVTICPQYIKNALGSTEFSVFKSNKIDNYYLFSVLKSNVMDRLY